MTERALAHKCSWAIERGFYFASLCVTLHKSLFFGSIASTCKQVTCALDFLRTLLALN
jgi:hypothetical protein